MIQVRPRVRRADGRSVSVSVVIVILAATRRTRRQEYRAPAFESEDARYSRPVSAGYARGSAAGDRLIRGHEHDGAIGHVVGAVGTRDHVAERNVGSCGQRVCAEIDPPVAVAGLADGAGSAGAEGL